MTFELTIHGESPAELLAALQQLNPTAQPQSEPVPQSEKQEAARQQPEKALPETPVNPTTSKEPSASTADTSGVPTANTTKPEAVSLDKIRDLARSLIVHGKRNEVQQVIKGTGAASITKLPPDRYTEAWEKLVALSREVDENAAG